MSYVPSISDIPKEAARRRQWIIYELRMRGLSCRALAARLDISVQAVSAVIHGRASLRVETEIATEIGLPIDALFPERYEGGVRIPHSRPYVAPDQNSGRAASRNIKSERVA